MSRKRWLIVAAIIALVALGRFVVWPLIDAELMKIPVTDGITAFRTGKVAQLRQSFTPDAVAATRTYQVPMSEVIDGLAPLLGDKSLSNPVRFGGFGKVTRHGATATAQFTLIFDMKSDDLPYRGVPVKMPGQVELRKTSLFRWQISRLSLRSSFFRDFIRDGEYKTLPQEYAP